MMTNKQYEKLNKYSVGLSAHVTGVPLNCWYYEEKKGMEIIIQHSDKTFSHLMIPWRELITVLRHYRKATK